jgi:fatty-acyl-CoA synthase
LHGQLLIGDVFRHGARATPRRIAAALDDVELTFSEIEDLSNRTARALAKLGVARGTAVATWTPTTLESIPLFAALAKLGAVFAPLNGSWTGDEVREVVARLEPALLIVDPASASSELGRLTKVMTFEELSSRSGKEEGPDVETQLSESDPHVVFYTSGSSGTPKGAVISHRANFLRSVPGALLEPRGAMVCPYPLFHMGAWTIALQQWQARDAVIFVRSADAGEICQAVERHGATRLNCVPAVWSRILAATDGDASSQKQNMSLSSLRFADTGTSATPPELLEAIDGALPHAQVRVFYGSTEAGGVTVLEHRDMRRKPGSCGVPGPMSTIRVDDRCELWVSGPLLFDGYLGDPRATDAALVDGWYRTGDLADVDQEGFVTITGRLGDVIRTGGESVSPSEVEALLGEHPSVSDLAVVGIPDAQWGEVVCAVIVADRNTSPPRLSDLRELCEGRLASFKIPRRLVLVEEIPRTASTGQVQRRLVVEQLVAGQLQNSVLAE